MAVLGPMPILIPTIVIEKLIAHGKLRQQGLIAVGQFLVGVVGDDVKLIHDGEQVCGLFVSQRTDGGIVELIVVVAEGMETEVIEYDLEE